ncbi:MFS transporter [Flaviflexus massiliensis]|uniref:MFS transporter n=1 Tax=Flaviflexus massiliensis TaxID=1522309 RepID=UPI0006D59537|nr:MFS transporter [Flaviflexus massiliensis]
MSVRSDLKTLLVHDGFKRLFTVRLISQSGDGMFQVGLATLYFFNPTNMTTASGVAAAFTVLLLPFTIVGPFVGPLLDRWSRQAVLFWGNTIRAILCVLLAVLMATGAGFVPVSVLALITLGINRFLLSALSAGLPHVVPREQLIMANSLVPTFGAVATVIGAALGFVINRLTPEGAVRDASCLAVAALLLLCAVWAASRIGYRELGPEGRVRVPLAKQIAAVLEDLWEGARYLALRGTPGHALVVMAVHRFLYGVNFIALLLISRNLLADPADADAGLAMFATLSGISLLGNGSAIVFTPLAHQRMTPAQWIVTCLGISMLSQVILIATPSLPWIAIAAVLMGLGVQGAKIAVDTIVQRDVVDSYRGRAFALYDMMYNAAFVGAAALAAVMLPDTGWSRGGFTVLVVLYLILATWYYVSNRKITGTPREVGS